MISNNFLILLTFFVEQNFCNVLVITPGPLLPQISPRKFARISRIQASAIRRPNVEKSNPITPAATYFQSSAPAKFVKCSMDLSRSKKTNYLIIYL